MSDLISRQAALNELPHAIWGKEWDEALAKAIIESLPTIDPVKHGKWVNDKGLYRCSACKNLWTHWWAVVVPEERMYKEMKYCPDCGAKMDGGEDETH